LTEFLGRVPGGTAGGCWHHWKVDPQQSPVPLESEEEATPSALSTYKVSDFVQRSYFISCSARFRAVGFLGKYEQQYPDRDVVLGREKVL
jgi:hypothetical protein